MASLNEFVDKMAFLDSKFGDTFFEFRHMGDDCNVVTMRLDAAAASEPNVNIGDVLQAINEIGVDPEDVDVYSTTMKDKLPRDTYNSAIMIEFAVDTP